MKIECPSCHLTGKVNEVELPPDGSFFNCPRCKSSFHVTKPAPPAGNTQLMNICPACQYSTFTDEQFAVCPKCGLSAVDHQEKLRNRQEQEQMQRDLEALHRSYRNPDLVRLTQEVVLPEQVRVAESVRITGWLCIAAGGALLCYGLAALVNYYSKDWQAILSEPLLEPLSRTRVFFSIGFFPWLVTLFSICLITVASQFLKLQGWAHKGLMKCAWGGMAVAVITETADFINGARISSSTPSLSYYAIGVISSLFMTLVWSAPACALLWYLQQDGIRREFPEA
jgi:predicted Zn finger-like uncharacterized protein